MENPNSQESDRLHPDTFSRTDHTNVRPTAHGTAFSLSAIPRNQGIENDELHPHSERLENILALHTEKRMKRPSSPNKKQSLGVSIPSQRRWLHYWSLILANKAPAGFWENPLTTSHDRVRIRQISIRMRDLTKLQKNLLKIANSIAVSTNSKHAKELRKTGQVWASLARYDDEFVAYLEKWEKHTRSGDGEFGKKRPGSDILDGKNLSNFFDGGRWDSVKMVKTFSKMGNLDVADMKEKIAVGFSMSSSIHMVHILATNRAA